MKTSVILIIIFLQGCTILAQDQFYSAEGAEKVEADKYESFHCFKQYDLRICTNSFDTKSLLIGFIVPFIPQISRGRLSYHHESDPSVRFENSLKDDMTIILSEGVTSCGEGQHSKSCLSVKTVTLAPGGSTWLKLPDEKNIEITVKNKGNFKLNRVRKFVYHLVSV